MPLDFHNFLERGKNVPLAIEFYGKSINGSLYLSGWSDTSACFAVTYNQYYQGYLIYRKGNWKAEKIKDKQLIEILGRVVEEFYNN